MSVPGAPAAPRVNWSEVGTHAGLVLAVIAVAMLAPLALAAIRRRGTTH